MFCFLVSNGCSDLLNRVPPVDLVRSRVISPYVTLPQENGTYLCFTICCTAKNKKKHLKKPRLGQNRFRAYLDLLFHCHQK